ncbi:hypothetical protein [Allosphingosinicella deserti]|uniref:Uncharacterized protein n=1 Tax=Allosphingosinicella deserti TaxID=2116704 RepID=A0A2P7QH02_9SPHN|nr:hypothetical protein [Sphingomonas deserti]PSJ37258.1 hypothetical protein C7I55_22285 [Sphingomonas deserti]
MTKKPTPPRPSRKTGTATRAEDGEGDRNKKIVAGAAIGIGSAAIVAALLYANRRGKGDKSEG